MKESKRLLRVLIFIGIIALIALLRHQGILSSYLQIDHILRRIKMMSQDNFGMIVILYCIVTILGSVVLALPGIAFAALAGALFNPIAGTFICALAATAGAGLSFIVGRFFLKDAVKPLVMKHRALRRLLFDEADHNGIKLLMVTRLVPIFPFNLQNFAYGITDISFRDYMLYSFLFMLPGTAMYTIGMSGIFAWLAQAEGGAEILHLLFYGAIVLVIGVVLYCTSKKLSLAYIEEAPDYASAETFDVLDESLKCIKCGKCTEACVFLKRRECDFSNLTRLRAYAFECFLCGKCSEICPVEVDGRHIMQSLRRELRQKTPCKLVKFWAIILEKRKYLFKRAFIRNQERVLYFGCNFPSFFPETTKQLVQLGEAHQMGILFDCCGKPLLELGLNEDAERIANDLNELLSSQGVKELIVVCPNCKAHLENTLEVPMVTIYERLALLGIQYSPSSAFPEDMTIFPPCPDRVSEAWYRSMAPFLPQGCVKLDQPQCCGAGGCAGIEAPALSKALQTHPFEKTPYVYCATCAGQFARGGAFIPKHVLSELLGVHEAPAVKGSLKNRALFKWTHKG